MDEKSTAPDIPRPAVSWRLFWLLALMVLLSSLMVVPYAMQTLRMGSPGLPGQTSQGAMSVGMIAQAIFIYWPMTWMGLFFAGRLGLGAPILAAWVEGLPTPPGWQRSLRAALLLGFGGGLVVLILAGVMGSLTQNELALQGIEIPADQMPNAWQGFLASISAGINEEILLRLFMLSLVAYLIQKARRQPDGRPPASVLWAANLVTALAFGALHLPNLTALSVSVTPFLAFYTISLNSLIGLAFGWLYWTFGLESAMLAHFFTDIVLHVLTVPLQGLGS